MHFMHIRQFMHFSNMDICVCCTLKHATMLTIKMPVSDSTIHSLIIYHIQHPRLNCVSVCEYIRISLCTQCNKYIRTIFKFMQRKKEKTNQQSNDLYKNTILTWYQAHLLHAHWTKEICKTYKPHDEFNQIQIDAVWMF